MSLPGTINTLRSVNIADTWQKLINIRKNSLKWNTLSSNGKVLFQTLITEIGNRLGVVLTVGGIAFIQKTLSISTATAQEIAFLGAIAFVREIPLLAPISNTLTKTLLKTSSNAFKTDIATVNLTKNLLSAGAPAVPARLVNTFDNTVLHLTSAGSAGSSSGLLPAEAALFTTPITSLAQTQTATQAFGIMQAWEIVGANAQKFYLLTFATQTASLLNASNIPITGLIGATNAQGQAVNINTITIQTTTPPNCTDFDALRTRANTLPAPMNVVDINLAIAKLCTVTDKTGVNAKLVSYSNTEIKSFLNQIKLTGQGARHISNHINATFGVPQVEAWKKLHTSGFETDFEYIRTLVYVGVNACTVTITPNITKSVTVVHGTFTTTFINDNINAEGGNIARTGPWNEILNVHPLIANVNYVLDARYTYKTDNIGRVKEISGEILKQSRPRDDIQPNGKQITTVTTKGGTRPPDVGGHMIANQFFGVSEEINYFPQLISENQFGRNVTTGLAYPARWFNMEMEWSRTVPRPNANPPVAGQDVRVIITPKFSNNNRRPDYFEVQYWYNNIQQRVPVNPPPITNPLPIPTSIVNSITFIIPNL